VNTYSTCLGAAVFLGWFLWTRDALAKGWIRSPLSLTAPITAFFGIVGAKALAALGEWETYGDSLLRWKGPLAVQGGMLATGLCFALWAALRRLPVLSVLDAHVRAFAVILLPIRVGCLGAGCCYGSPTDGSFGVLGSDGILRHPTQVYEIGLALLLVALLHGAPLVRSVAGRPLFAFAIVYGLGRSLIEIVREDTRPLFAWVTYPQLIGLSMFVLGTVGATISFRSSGPRRAAVSLPAEPQAAASPPAPRPRSRRRSSRFGWSDGSTRSHPQPFRSNRPENQEQP